MTIKYSDEWISIKDRLPDENAFVQIKMKILFIPIKSKGIRALFSKGYFNVKGENVTRWVTHWQPLPEPTKK